MIELDAERSRERKKRPNSSKGERVSSSAQQTSSGGTLVRVDRRNSDAKMASQYIDSLHSSGSNSNSNRKQNHCEIEKRRRDKMNQYITELASVIPSFQHHHQNQVSHHNNSSSSSSHHHHHSHNHGNSSNQMLKLDKLTVLRMAVQHVKSLRSSLCSFSSFHLRPSFLSSGNLLKNLILQMASHEAQDNLFMVVSCDRGKVLFMSKSSKDILNQEQSELTGQCLFDLLHKDDVSKVKEQISHLSLMPREQLIDSRTLQPIKHNQRLSFNQIQHQMSQQASSTPPPGVRRSFFCRMRSGRDKSGAGSGSSTSSGRSSADKTVPSPSPSPYNSGSSSGSDQTSPSGSSASQNCCSPSIRRAPERDSKSADATPGNNSCRCQISPAPNGHANRAKSAGQPLNPLPGSGAKSRGISSGNAGSISDSISISSSSSSNKSSGSSTSLQRSSEPTSQQTIDNEQPLTGESAGDLNLTKSAHQDLRTTTTTTSSATTSNNREPTKTGSNDDHSSDGTKEASESGQQADEQTALALKEHRTNFSNLQLGIGDGNSSDCSGRDSGIAGSQNARSDAGSTVHKLGCPHLKRDLSGGGGGGARGQSSGRLGSKKALPYTVMHCTGYLKTITLDSNDLDDYEDELDNYDSDGASSEDESSASSSSSSNGRARSRTITCLVAICRRSPMDREFEPDKPLTFTCRYSIEGKFVFVDQRTTIALGYTPQQLLGTSHYAYCHKDSVNTFKECHRQSILRPEPVSSDIYQFRRANGKHMWLQTSLKSFRNPWTKFIDYIVANHTTAEGTDAHYNEGCVPTKFNQYLAGEGSQSSSPASSSSLSLPSMESKKSSSPSSSSIGSSYSMDSFASGGSIQALLKRIDRIKSGGIKHGLDATPPRKHHHHQHHHHHHHHSHQGGPSSSSGGSASKGTEDSGNYSDPQSFTSSSQTSGSVILNEYAASLGGRNQSAYFIPDTGLEGSPPEATTDGGFHLQKQAGYRNFSLLADPDPAAATADRQRPPASSNDIGQQSRRDITRESKATDNSSRGASKSARPCLNNSRQHLRQSGTNSHYQHKNQKSNSLGSSSAWSSPSGSVYSNSASSQSSSQSAQSSSAAGLHHLADLSQEQHAQRQLEMDQGQRHHHQHQQQQQQQQQQRYDKIGRQSAHYVLQPVAPVPMACSNSYGIRGDQVQLMPVAASGYIGQQDYGVDMNQQQMHPMEDNSAAGLHQGQPIGMAAMGQQAQIVHQRQQASGPGGSATINMVPMVWSNQPGGCTYQSMGSAIHPHEQQQQGGTVDDGQSGLTGGHQSFGAGVAVAGNEVNLMNIPGPLGSSNEQIIGQQSAGCHQCANHICYNQQQPQHHHHQQQPQQRPQHYQQQQQHQHQQQQHNNHYQQQHLMVGNNNNQTDLNNVDFTSLVVNGDLDEEQILECLADYDEEVPFYRMQNNTFPQYNINNNYRC